MKLVFSCTLLFGMPIVLGKTTCDNNLPNVVRLPASSLTRDDFVQRLNAGDSFVLTDMFGAGFAPGLSNWSCEFLGSSASFKDVEVRREYGEDSEDIEWVTLKDLIPAVKDGRITGQTPYYWAVREPMEMSDAQRRADPGSSISWDMKQFKVVQNYLKRWWLFPDDMTKNMKSRPEVWFSFPSAGAKAHMDGHADSTMSLQLSGAKLWTILPHIPPRSVAHVQRLFGDGQCTKRGDWPMPGARQVLLKPGDALFFPPGTIHETCGQPSESETGGGNCAVSITYQFSSPYPWAFLRQHLKSILLTPDLEGIRGFAKRGLVKREPAFLDIDADGVVSTAEIKSVDEIFAEVNDLEKSVPADIRKAARRAGDDPGPKHLRKWQAQALAKEKELHPAGRPEL